MATCVPMERTMLPECDYVDFNFPYYDGVGRISEIRTDGFSIELGNKQIIAITKICPEWLQVDYLVLLEMGGNEYTLSLIENANG